ncbi:secretion/conjugation apparatus DotM-related subunit [Acidithiobacillus sulfurivorans]|uniref:DotM C-terminal cytoplasmic domain-containing protein n=1 Tax=Acidithiobacillus sulfurivorans TaxID=1958756 RepID=A0ABS6A259_9PROT|nr:hypothetical protein [Acidithiobacillus sulfurivorans]MBU2760968.1 hypothetical protein [Acidithiobacillus sulfurivorans]
MAAGKGGDSSDELLGILVALLLGVGLFAFWVWHFYGDYHAGINQIFIWITQAELLPFLPFDQTAQLIFFKLQDTPSGQFTFDQMWAALSIGGSYFRWLALPIIGLITWMRWRQISWIERYRRSFTMKTLVEHNAEFFPALKPIINRGRSLLDELPAEGPWRVAESAMLFALKHGIITTADGKPVPVSWCYQKNGLPRTIPSIPEGGLYFQPVIAEDVLRNRMGPAAPSGRLGFERLPRYQKGLAGAFCAFALGYRKEGQKILNAMSESFNEKVAVKSQNAHEVPKDFPINILNAEAYVKRALKPRPIDACTTEDNLAARLRAKVALHDSFVYGWLGALLEAAREKGGTLPPQQFIWLRPANRELWYFLNSLGGNACHNEACAFWSHYEAENVLKRPISTPVVKYGVVALKNSITSEGWLDLAPGQSWQDLKGKA